ncbi:hypothetical protein [Actinomadura sp. 9N407]|uniref:hypothetical protein n=1 Tax=Actinomadura sp. 9N407 TaxID=3375154 RepID=UPI0037B25886
MRLILMLLAVLAGMALVVVGVPSVLVGIAEQRHIDRAYVVGFVPGSGCGDAHALHLSVRDGEPLDCVSAGLFGSGKVRLPGFTDAQNDQVDTLAEQLGSNGLSAAEQRAIQNQVDKLTATVPPSERPYHDQVVRGTGRAWLGAGMVIAGILGCVAALVLGPPKQRRAT